MVMCSMLTLGVRIRFIITCKREVGVQLSVSRLLHFMRNTLPLESLFECGQNICRVKLGWKPLRDAICIIVLFMFCLAVFQSGHRSLYRVPI